MNTCCNLTKKKLPVTPETDLAEMEGLFKEFEMESPDSLDRCITVKFKSKKKTFTL